MKILRDNKRIARNLRKEFLKVKGKLWILGVYIDTRGKKIIKLSDAGSEIIRKEIDIQRQTFNAITKGIKLCVVENHASSSTKLLKILDWGMSYGNKDVTVKRFIKNNKYYTGVWVKGSRGIQSVSKYSPEKQDRIYKSARKDGLTYDNHVWDNDY